MPELINRSDAGYLQLLVEEYKSLRDEAKQASINMFAALQLGAGFVGVALAAAFTQWGKSTAVIGAVLMVLVPLLASLSMFMWLGEAIRFRRVGDYLAFLEQKIGLLFGPEDAFSMRVAQLQQEAETQLGFVPSQLMAGPLSWEQWLRNSRAKGFFKTLIVETSGHQQLIYLLRLAFFPLLMLLSYGVGVFYVHRHPAQASHWITGFLDDVEIAVVFGAFLILVSGVLAAIIAWRLQRRAGRPAHIERTPERKQRH